MSRPIEPGAVLGVLGSGQLGRMFAISARRLGYRVHVLSPDDDTPTGQVADVEIRAAYDDLDAVARFAKGVSVVTFEFENVLSSTTEVCERFAPVRPAGKVLHVTQHRVREKSFLKNAGLPVTPFVPVNSREDLDAAISRLGLPSVLKTASWGYDGKGQIKLNSPADVDRAWSQLGSQELILEQFIDFAGEVSVVGARGLSGEFVAYGPMRNSHRNHILDISSVPANLPPGVAQRAVEITREVFRQLDVVGVLCVEFFLTTQGELLINELAPRPHNSGHLTIDAHVTCQFEQQVRAVCGLPLGSGELLRPAAMANLLGDEWFPNPPRWDEVLRHGDVKLHLYGKAEPRRARKMGHLTALADSAEAAIEKVLAARRAMQGIGA